MQEFQKEIGNVVGNVFVAAACVAYFGAFTSSYRVQLVQRWTDRCKELEIPVTDDLSLLKVFESISAIERHYVFCILRRNSVIILVCEPNDVIQCRVKFDGHNKHHYYI